MVSELKKEALKKLAEDLAGYSAVGVVDMKGLPARQLQEIRRKLKGKAVIRMYKKNLILLALEKHKDRGMDRLEKNIGQMPALLFSNENPFRLARIIESSKSKALAKAGDIAPGDISVGEGLTDLPAGPAIGELQRAKIPAGVEAGKIKILKDTIVARKGEAINEAIANVLAKLSIKPMEIGLNVVAAWENRQIYAKDVLFKPQEAYLEEVRHAYLQAFNLSVHSEYFTKDNMAYFLGKANKEALSLAVSAELYEKEIIGMLLAKAEKQAEAVSKAARI
ncbi:MAG: 50S ribosomal protein L10 [Candidatus Aenigmarchaeota archaeon]|nr:50S ribosomal protein L10 [Candidatus Aenigmarchaeota archaeon]